MYLPTAWPNNRILLTLRWHVHAQALLDDALRQLQQAEHGHLAPRTKQWNLRPQAALYAVYSWE